ncbi:MAG TPA: LytTR family DNA-binding domain-containing protein [Bacteroidales bacterium]|nr:LytTR family DNA-binding domain-containing protein [Bacteroidales bacterium]
MNKKIPDFSYNLLYNIYFLLFTLLFSLVFIAVYSPFGFTIWFDPSRRMESFAIASIVIFAGFGFLFLSRMILYLVGGKYKLTYYQYFLWIMLEFLIFAVIYSFFTKFILQDPRLLFKIILRTSFYTFLILLIPYSLSIFYFYYLERSKELAFLKRSKIKKKSSTSILNPKEQSELIHFYDEKGILRLSVKHFNLFYVESDVNYISVFYTQNDEMQKFTLRSSLAKVEEGTHFVGLIRCHRSFLINFDKVKSFKKEKDGGIIELDHPSNPVIPVSKTYIAVLLDKFQTINPLESV